MGRTGPSISRETMPVPWCKMFIPFTNWRIKGIIAMMRVRHGNSRMRKSSQTSRFPLAVHAFCYFIFIISTMDYFITLGDKIHGPTPEREMRTYLAYGSVKADDLLRRSDEEEWYPAKLFPEFATALPSPTGNTSKWLLNAKAAEPKRSMRFREVHHVAEDQRAGLVTWRLLSGFVCRPLTFWRAASTVFTSKIYRGAKDAQGFLRTWPRWMEVPVTLLVLLHAGIWTGVTFWAAPKVQPMVTLVVEHAQAAWQEVVAVQPPLGGATQAGPVEVETEPLR